MTRRGLALFDFDGTLTTRDTFLDFIRWRSPWPRLLSGLLRSLPAVLAMHLGLMTRQRAKERVMRIFFGGEPVERFHRDCLAYAAERIPQLIRPGARATLESHRRAGDRIIVISASLEDWIAPWCAAEQIELLATVAEVRDGRLTGNIDGANCHGPEKVRRLRGYLDPADYHPIHAYGDSSGDREMLALADHAHFRPFRDRA